jgi:hypothetical protein
MAAAWLLWLLVCLAMVAGAVALPATPRVVFGLVLFAANIPAIRGAVLLRGPRAIRVLEWDEEGRFRVRLAGDRETRTATLHPASLRLGIAFLVLRFSTRAGSRVVLIDGGLQDPVAFRRLSRRLSRAMLIPSRPKV